MLHVVKNGQVSRTPSPRDSGVAAASAAPPGPDAVRSKASLALAGMAVAGCSRSVGAAQLQLLLLVLWAVMNS